MHPTMSSSQMVVGSVFSGDEMDLIPRVIASAEEACQAAEAITAHRAVLQEDRRLKRQQEEALHLSEVEDRRKAEDKAQETTQVFDEQLYQGKFTLQSKRKTSLPYVHPKKWQVPCTI
ncbi:uncharacterized protein [Acropora muricata]